MAKVTITLTDSEEGVLIHTDGLVGPGGTSAEQVAYMILRQLASDADIDWESVATPVRSGDGGGEGN